MSKEWVLWLLYESNIAASELRWDNSHAQLLCPKFLCPKQGQNHSSQPPYGLQRENDEQVLNCSTKAIKKTSKKRTGSLQALRETIVQQTTSTFHVLQLMDLENLALHGQPLLDVLWEHVHQQTKPNAKTKSERSCSGFI